MQHCGKASLPDLIFRECPAPAFSNSPFIEDNSWWKPQYPLAAYVKTVDIFQMQE
jgi:hypothetical protein